MRDFILLFVNGREHRVTGRDAFLTLSTFLRDRLKLSGTKIVCSEGDCGSCSVLCGRLKQPASAGDGELAYATIDSCIRFVFQLDGCHIVTVEGLSAGDPPESMNSVQQAMVACHGSQCGFCTPGFVMAMTGMLENSSEPNELGEDDWRRGLSGNLCRCTGYSPIIAAGKQAAQAKCSVRSGVSERFPAEPILAAIQGKTNDGVEIAINVNGDRDQQVACPVALTDALDFLNRHPAAKIVAGATDVGVQFNHGRCDATTWLDLNRVDELATCEIEGDEIVLGSRATWTDVERLVQESVPQFYEIVSVFGSPQIRNAGTLGGNIINASPIADSLPFLFVCNATLQLTSFSGTRTVDINDFYRGYKQFDLQPGELLTQIRIPLPPASRSLRLYKVSRRRDMDISTFTGAIWIERNGDTIKDAGVAYGAVGPVVRRLAETEAFLRGKPFTEETMRAAGDVAVGEITPITDVRGGANFRQQLARNVLVKFFHEVNVAEVSV